MNQDPDLTVDSAAMEARALAAESRARELEALLSAQGSLTRLADLRACEPTSKIVRFWRWFNRKPDVAQGLVWVALLAALAEGLWR